MGNPVETDLMGIMVGHIYFFFDRVSKSSRCTGLELDEAYEATACVVGHAYATWRGCCVGGRATGSASAGAGAGAGASTPGLIRERGEGCDVGVG